MKRLLMTFACLMMVVATFGQAKKPTIMVIPSDLWCNTNGFTTTFDNQGTEVVVSDYTKALQNDTNLLPVISKINDMMADRGFPLKNLESEIKSINNRSAEMSMLTSSNGGEIQSSPYDELRKRAKADIIMQLTWTVNKVGPKYSIQYTLQGIDAYTNKQVAGATGNGAPSFTADIPVMLESAVNANMDSFCDRLQSHFDDLFENGREVSININVFDTSSVNIESDFDGYELYELIDDWMYDNTVNGRYSISDSSENYMYMEQVRIPLYDDRGRPTDANRFSRDLVRYLKGDPCYIEAIKVVNQGLGQVTLVIGDK